VSRHTPQEAMIAALLARSSWNLFYVGAFEGGLGPMLGAHPPRRPVPSPEAAVAAI
jgi:hypothetical protein